MSATERLLGDHFSEEPVVKTFGRRKMPRICGPKLSNCCFVISIWGMIMLVLMGVFFRINSVALLEDIPAGKDGYNEASQSCFIAAGLYVVIFILCSYQKFAISRGYSRF